MFFESYAKHLKSHKRNRAAAVRVFVASPGVDVPPCLAGTVGKKSSHTSNR
jgi:hypothetical protein